MLNRKLAWRKEATSGNRSRSVGAGPGEATSEGILTHLGAIS
jgi:hypothetical protein